MDDASEEYRRLVHQQACADAWDEDDFEELARLLAIDPAPAQWVLNKHYGPTMLVAEADGLRVLLAAGADPWAVSYEDQVYPVISLAAYHFRKERGDRRPYAQLIAGAPHRHAEAGLLSEVEVTEDLARLRTLGRVAARLRFPTTLPALLTLWSPKTFRLDELEQRVRAYAPTADATAAVVADGPEGATPLHLLCAALGSRYDYFGQIKAARAVVALLEAGADPCALDAHGRTPREVFRMLRPITAPNGDDNSDDPLPELLQAAEADVRARQLAVAMALHPRLGRGSGLGALGDDLLRGFVATTRRCCSAAPQQSTPQIDYAMALAAALEAEAGVRVALPGGGLYAPIDREFRACARARAPLTPALRRRFRVLWLARHAATAEDVRRLHAAGHWSFLTADTPGFEAMLCEDGRLSPPPP